MNQFITSLSKYKKTVFWLFVGLLIMLMTIFYWDKSQPFLNWLTDTSSSQGDLTLSVGTNVWPGYEPFYLARELGYYQNTGIQFVEYSSTTQVLRAFRNNDIQVGALTLDEVLQLSESGHSPRIILVNDISDGADVILAKPNLKNLTDLKGHRVGVENTALGAYVITRACQLAGLPLKEITIVPSEIDEHEGVFDRGEVDAVVTFEPVRTRLLAKGAKELFNSSQIAGEIVDVVAIRSEVLEQRPQQVDALLSGWFKALTYFHNNSQNAATIMSKRLKLSPQEVLASYRGLHLPDLEENRAMLKGTAVPLWATISRLAEVMKGRNLLQKNLRVEKHLLAPESLDRMK
jgi:NitT/TauT family transport system substrate-binding protein